MKKKCPACEGKKYHTVWEGAQGFADFPGDKGYKTPCESVKKKCSRCDGRGYVVVKLWWMIQAKLSKYFNL